MSGVCTVECAKTVLYLISVFAMCAKIHSQTH